MDATAVDVVLRHPLVVLVATALLTGLLVPGITREWQLRQKAIEIKVGLVAEMSEAVMRFPTLGIYRRQESTDWMSAKDSLLRWKAALIRRVMERDIRLDVSPAVTRFVSPGRILRPGKARH
jgi:hypothetical protein